MFAQDGNLTRPVDVSEPRSLAVIARVYFDLDRDGDVVAAKPLEGAELGDGGG